MFCKDFAQTFVAVRRSAKSCGMLRGSSKHGCSVTSAAQIGSRLFDFAKCRRTQCTQKIQGNCFIYKCGWTRLRMRTRNGSLGFAEKVRVAKPRHEAKNAEPQASLLSQKLVS